MVACEDAISNILMCALLATIWRFVAFGHLEAATLTVVTVGAILVGCLPLADGL